METWTLDMGQGKTDAALPLERCYAGCAIPSTGTGRKRGRGRDELHLPDKSDMIGFRLAFLFNTAAAHPPALTTVRLSAFLSA